MSMSSPNAGAKKIFTAAKAAGPINRFMVFPLASSWSVRNSSSVFRRPAQSSRDDCAGRRNTLELLRTDQELARGKTMNRLIGPAAFAAVKIFLAPAFGDDMDICSKKRGEGERQDCSRGSG